MENQRNTSSIQKLTLDKKRRISGNAGLRNIQNVKLRKKKEKKTKQENTGGYLCSGNPWRHQTVTSSKREFIGTNPYDRG